MTPEEVEEACNKFRLYLEANGVRVRSHLICFDDRACGFGTMNDLHDLLVAHSVDQMGYRLVPKESK